jgi:hypothetical protein
MVSRQVVFKMRRLQRSREFEHYRRTLQCPNGHRHALTFIEGTGQVIENLRLRDRLMLEDPLYKSDDRIASIELFGRLRQFNHDRSGGLSIQRFRFDSMFACDVCDDRWPVFIQRELKILDYRVTGLIETPIGTEERRLDWTRSKTDSTRTLTFTREWVDCVEVGWEQLTSRDQSRSAGVKGSHRPLEINVGIQQRITESLKETHSVKLQTKVATTQAVEYKLPAGKITVIRIFWKQVWEEHECRVRLPGNDEIVPIPYRVATKVASDEAVEHI